MTKIKKQKIAQNNVEMRGHYKTKPWTDLYHSLLSISWPIFLGWMTLVYFLINLVFGVGYYLIGPEGFAGLSSNDGSKFFIECFFFSVQTFSTIGYGHISPLSVGANILICVQAFLGLLSVGMITGLFFSRFSRPTARVIFSDKALITQHLGKQSFVLRMANERMNRIIDATARVTLMQTIATPEGNSFRQMVDLKLVRQSTQMFFLSWTVSHVIDKESPLYNKTYEDLIKDDIEIIVSIAGHDETFSQLVHARHTYKVRDIVFNKFFKDMMIRSENQIVIEIDKISQLRD